MDKINEFRGEYYFLSNFYNADVTYQGVIYKNNEAAFQSAKAIDLDTRIRFSKLDPLTAKREGRRVKLRSDWEEIKFDIMYEVCYNKFRSNEELKQELIATGSAHLEEGNTWGDIIWGTVDGKGQNNLGKILMRVRREIVES